MHIELKRIPDRLLFLEDFTKYDELLKEYEKVQTQDITIDDLSPDVKKYYEDQVNPRVDSTPSFLNKDFMESYKKSSRLFPSLHTVLKNIKRLTLHKTIISYIRQLSNTKRLASLEGFSHPWYSFKKISRQWQKIRSALKQEYESLVVKPDLTKKFVYVPLHVQPERSTSAEGGFFADQVLMIETLSKALPKDWVIYVKEHTPQWLVYRGHLGRYKGYYKQIDRLKNVSLIPVNVSTFDLIEKAQTVATVNGTALWEASLRLKPVIMFGVTWHMHCDGVFRVSSVAECRNAFDEISKGVKVSKKRVLQFLKALDNLSVLGHDNHKLNMFVEMSDEEIAENIAEGYYSKLI